MKLQKKGHDCKHSFLKKINKWAEDRLKRDILTKKVSKLISPVPREIGDIKQLENINDYLLRKNPQSDPLDSSRQLEFLQRLHLLYEAKELERNTLSVYLFFTLKF